MSSAEPGGAPTSDGPTEREVWRGPKFGLVELTVPGRDGRAHTHGIIRHPGAVAILPILEPGEDPGESAVTIGGMAGDRAGDRRARRVVLIRNRRPSVGEELLEVPAGTMEPPEPPSDAARRECAEETGYAPAELEGLGWFYTTPGMTDERMHLFIGRGLRHVGQDLDEAEDLRPVIYSADDAVRLAEAGEITDGKSLVLILLARSRGVL